MVPVIFLFVVLIVSTVSVSFSSISSNTTVSTTGSVVYFPQIQVTMNFTRMIGVNNLSLGFQLDGRDISYWKGSSTARDLSKDANFKLVRFFYHRLGQPCTRWSEETKTGSWSWTNIDDLTNKIFAINAEPLIVLGFAKFDGSGLSGLPSGMSSDPITKLPDPDQWAAYCADWVEHFENEGMDVVYYEIINESHHYFEWGGTNTARRGYFKDLFNAAAVAMRAINPKIKLGNDNSMVQSNNLDKWFATNLEPLDFLSWHGYITGNKGESDSSLIDKAQTDEGATYGPSDFIDPARQNYYDENGVWLPVIQSEANLNYAYSGGTDPRIQQMLGGVYVALWTRMLILKGTVSHNIFFDFGGSGASDTKFGMVNKDDDEPWYPYYTHYMVGGIGNLCVGDTVVESTSSSNDIVLLAWKHGNKINILLINTVTGNRTVELEGVSGTFDWWKIDNSEFDLQNGTIDVANSIALSGYTVMLLQISE